MSQILIISMQCVMTRFYEIPIYKYMLEIIINPMHVYASFLRNSYIRIWQILIMNAMCEGSFLRNSYTSISYK